MLRDVGVVVAVAFDVELRALASLALSWAELGLS
jgi:hypothetical protein